jgi:hypothetical protein
VNGERGPGDEDREDRAESEDAKVSRPPEVAPMARLTEKWIVGRGFGLDDAEADCKCTSRVLGRQCLAVARGGLDGAGGSPRQGQV